MGPFLKSETPNMLSIIYEKLQIYKQRRGHIPESLRELQLETNPLLTIDMYSEIDSVTHKYHDFIYKKQTDTFMLFSVGPDHTTFTSDDIQAKRPFLLNYKKGR